MTRAHTDYLRDILDAIAKAQSFVAGLDFDDFRINDEKVFAVVRALEIIGEATKYIPESERIKYPQIPWKAVAGMRDKLIHGYFVVSLSRVWETVQRDLPPLEKAVSQMLNELENTDKQ
ncbi:MAG: DUF86 domain-containing protein [Chloroflexi bacterium]|nr:DUF86 domain-containing protein [Chloroflexota bacterium]NOG37486.1 DUF86 domain-containing protein [Chloroflexota bacterium]